MLRNALPKIVTPLPGPKAKEIIERRAKAMPDAIRCIYPCVIKRGEGAMFEDVDGNIILDWVGGVGVLNIGYSNEKAIEAVKAQSEKYFHSMMNITTHEGYIKLAEKLNEIVPVKGETRKTMLVNSGAEADENAVKIAKSYTGRPNIIVFTGAFHGRTTLTMAMTAKKAYAVGMGPFPDGIYRAEFPYLYRAPGEMTEEEAIQYYVEKLEQVFIDASPAEYVAAIVVEPVQGEGGFVPAPIEWVKAVRKICDEKGILLIADEVQTGFARTGRMFATEYWKEAGAAPDIITLAKSIAGGMPLSAVVARTEIMDGVTPGTIGGTYCGNAVSCAAALAVIEEMEKEDYPAKARKIAEKVMARWNEWKEKYEVVGDVRGLGCMAGIEFVTDKKSKTPNAKIVNDIVDYAIQKGLLLENAGTYGNVIRFLTPLCITDEQLEAGLQIYEEAIKACM
ncbi:MAG TPA: aspartate aminotransferase family protein [Bacillota bacterium]|jgi:4-aminobutyrate aminotransferase/(S)-3-amino-2-methylpropionate transaminase|nr:4-aminobutyrate--2-oxoglutarate transaminase [Clostridiales bacterium UBA9856]HOA42813.1 aspartate aminotransferase family protein [Bacillota bacterium]HPZ59466.1 aspartate aminotransferase family protein [Bacillota bacterium]HQC81988.1 aspartate aminotransferase family protein [Bacillota bacterium]